MNMLNSVIIEGVVTISPTSKGVFSIDTCQITKGGEEEMFSLICKLSDGLNSVYKDRIKSRRRVRMVGRIAAFSIDYGWNKSIGLFVENIELFGTVIKSGKYIFTKEN